MSGQTVRFQRFPVRLAIGLGCLFMMGGCDAVGPEPIVTTTITGRFHMGDRPINQGWIQVVPVEGTLGTLRSAPLDGQGRFRIDKVPVGRVAFGFGGPYPSLTSDRSGDEFLFKAYNLYVVRMTISANSPSLDIDLNPARRVYEGNAKPTP